MNAHTQSAELLRSFHRGLPTDRLPVPVLVERLKAARYDVKRLDATPTRIGSQEERRIGDEMSALDDRMDILRTALRAAADAALVRETGMTLAEFEELQL